MAPTRAIDPLFPRISQKKVWGHNRASRTLKIRRATSWPSADTATIPATTPSSSPSAPDRRGGAGTADDVSRKRPSGRTGPGSETADLGAGRSGPEVTFADRRCLGAAIRSRHGDSEVESGMSLTHQEVMQVVNRYIGVAGGYLGDFSYRTHAEFYPEYCNLDIDPSKYAGTTRERFIEILSTRPPRDQAKILRGVIERFDEESSPTRARLRPELEAWINRLESAPAVVLNVPDRTRDVVMRALADADQLIRTNGATSAVDRIHTALHGHVLALCEAAGIEADRDTTMNRALKLLRQSHPGLAANGPRADDITRVLGALATVLDSLNPLRNNASVAHPNEELLDEPEAHLAINAARSVFAFLDARLGATSAAR